MSPPKKYIGLSSTTFKDRFRTHTASFRNERLWKQTELSEYIWGLKRDNVTWNIKWRKICNETHYNTSTGRCLLCLREKLEISKIDQSISINRKSEMYKNCVHKWRFKLSAFDPVKEEIKYRKNQSQLSDGQDNHLSHEHNQVARRLTIDNG